MSETTVVSNHDHAGHKTGTMALMMAALGVVYGDIGTSPLYAMTETVLKHGLPRTPENVMGACSLFFWALTIVVSFKYILLVMRADNNGEGGIFALLGLIRNGDRGKPAKKIGWLVWLIVVGACLLYGDGMITPAISVLSAVEGIEIVTPAFKSAVIPLSLIILVALFSIQKHGTAGIGKLFGPVMLVWFVAIAALGIPQIFKHPEVLASVNPYYAVRFVMAQGWHTFPILGAVVLCITGGEALYADMGHFGARPIRMTWATFVFPALVINYLGQGARLLDPAAIPNDNLFYALCPQWALVPMVVLATAATVIASQALISGAFSLTQQAIALGLAPRMLVVHTNEDHEGQIYVPYVNWALLLGCVVLVWKFGSSSALAAAYGIAVTGTMGITTIAFQYVAIHKWHWNAPLTRVLCTTLVMVDLVFFLANTLKFLDGGFVPVIIAAALFYVFWLWAWGRAKLAEAYDAFAPKPVSWMIDLNDRLLESEDKRLIDGPKTLVQLARSMVFMTSRPILSMDDSIPVILRMYIKHSGGLPEFVVLCHVRSVNRPYVKEEDRYQIISFADNVKSLVLTYGYMETPRVKEELAKLIQESKLKLPPRAYTVNVGLEKIAASQLSRLDRFHLAMFCRILDNSPGADDYFGLGEDSRGLIKVTVEVTREGSKLLVPELDVADRVSARPRSSSFTEETLPS